MRGLLRMQSRLSRTYWDGPTANPWYTSVRRRRSSTRTTIASTRSRSLRPVACLLGLIVALSPLTQAAPDPIHASGDIIQYTTGADLFSSLRALDIESTSGEPLSLSFEFTAESVRLEIDETRSDVMIPAAGVEPTRETIPYEFSNPTALGAGQRDASKIFLAPLEEGTVLPNAWFGGSKGDLVASSVGSVEQPEPFPERDARSVNVGDAVVWTTSSLDHEFVIQGDWHMRIREVPFTIQDSDSSYEFVGDEEGEGVDGVATTGQVQRTAHVFARNATLTVTATSHDAVHSVYADVRSADFMDGVTVTGYNGPNLPEGIEHLLRDGDLIIQEDVQFTNLFGGDGVRFDIRVGEDVLPVPDEGEPIEPDTVVSEPPGQSWLWWLIGIFGVVLVGGGAVLRYHHPSLSRVENAMDNGRYNYAARHSLYHVHQSRAPGKASLIHAVSLLRLGKPEDAGEFLEELSLEQRPEAPTWAYLLATAKAWLGQQEEAIQLLVDCLHQAPQYIEEVRGNPVFGELLKDPRLTTNR